MSSNVWGISGYVATEASEKVQKSLKTGDLMLSKWEEKIEGEETKTQWLLVRLRNHNGRCLVNQEGWLLR